MAVANIVIIIPLSRKFLSRMGNYLLFKYDVDKCSFFCLICHLTAVINQCYKSEKKI